jgi:molecular chaperone DnaK
VNVNAKDLGTGKEQSMTITGGTKLSDDEIKRMMDDAEAHADEDRQRRAEAEARNQGDNAVYQTEKSLKEHGDKLEEQDRKQIEEALDEAREALKGSDVDRITRSTEQLVTASQKFAEVLYRQAQTQPDGASQTQSSGGEDVVDAEVVDEGEERSA